MFFSKKEHSQKPTTNQETPKIRIVFMGTPAFAETILRRLLDEQYHVVAAYTQPDKAVGRKQEMQSSPVKLLAQSRNIPTEEPLRFDGAAIEHLKTYKPDLIVVAAYGRILPQEVLELPGFGCINVHASLLPELRGASPIQNALLEGKTETGVSIMLMDKGVDTGDVLSQKTVPIDPMDTTPPLTERLTEAGADLLLETLPSWIERTIEPQKQDDSKATLCQLIEREDGHIFWTEDAESIYNRFRALYPWPGIFGFWKKDDQLLRIKFLRVSYQKHNPQTAHRLGEVFELGEKVGVQASAGVVFLEEVQLEGKTSASIQEFVKGYPQFIGSILQ
jgi:methionyl-tRNA formyltransferase